MPFSNLDPKINIIILKRGWKDLWLKMLILGAKVSDAKLEFFQKPPYFDVLQCKNYIDIMFFNSFENIDQAAQFASKFNRIGPAILKWLAVKLAYFKNAQKTTLFQKIVSMSNFDENACFKVLWCSSTSTFYVLLPKPN